MLVNVKLYVSWSKGLLFNVADFIGVFNFEWHCQNGVGNIAIHVLWRDREQLYWLRSIQHKEDLPNVILYLQLL